MEKIGVIIFNSSFKSEEILKNDLVEIINLEVELGGESYTNKTIEELGKRVEELKEIPKTSQPTTASYIEAYEKMLQKFENVLVLTPAKHLSGTHQGAVLAKDMIENNERIHLVHTGSFAFSEIYFCENAIKLINEGVELNEIIKTLESLTDKLTTYIIPGNFDYLKMSGRVSTTQLVVGKLISLKLLIKNKGLETGVHAKGRGFKSILKNIVKELEENPNKELIYYGGLAPDEEELKMLGEILAKDCKTIYSEYGSVIMAAHFGPKTLGFMIVEK